MKMVRSVDGAKNIHLNFPNAEGFMGMKIEKTNTVSNCVGIENFINAEGKNIKLLVWSVTLKETGQTIIRKTVSENFRVSDLPGTDKAFKKT